MTENSNNDNNQDVSPDENKPHEESLSLENSTEEQNHDVDTENFESSEIPDHSVSHYPSFYCLISSYND